MTSRITYVNGRYVPSREAVISVEDRGNQFADAIYEACQIKDGAIIDLRRHMDRMDRSLSELRLAAPMSRAAMTHVLREVARRNKVRNGYIYWQISRGAAPRDHAFPVGVTPTFTSTAKSLDVAAAEQRYENGVPAITLPDNRWERVDIKTVGLLPNSLAKQAAREAGAHEAIFVDAEGYVTEGSSCNVWLVDGEGRLVTRPADKGILRGITRSVLIDVAAAEGVPVVEKRFTVAEMKAAREVFVTSAGAILCPLTSIDGDPVANGTSGSVAARLRRRFHDFAERTPI